MYVSVTARKYSLMKIPVEGGTPVPITDEEIIMPSLSPDGKTIVGTIAAGPRNQVVTMPWEGGPIRRLFDIERPKVHWSADGKAVYYVKTESGVRNVWRHPLDGGSPRRVTAFTDSEDIRWFAVAPDGERLAVARGTTIRDVVRIRDVK
jgi:Tol biopolymer transport system component